MSSSQTTRKRRRVASNSACGNETKRPRIKLENSACNNNNAPDISFDHQRGGGDGRDCLTNQEPEEPFDPDAELFGADDDHDHAAANTALLPATSAELECMTLASRVLLAPTIKKEPGGHYAPFQVHPPPRSRARRSFHHDSDPSASQSSSQASSSSSQQRRRQAPPTPSPEREIEIDGRECTLIEAADRSTTPNPATGAEVVVDPLVGIPLVDADDSVRVVAHTELEEHNPYYLVNFELMLQCVMQRHAASLLSQAERDAVASFMALPLKCRLLFTRLFPRKRRWFSVESLASQYSELGSTSADAVQHLIDTEFAIRAKHHVLDPLFNQEEAEFEFCRLRRDSSSQLIVSNDGDDSRSSTSSILSPDTSDDLEDSQRAEPEQYEAHSLAVDGACGGSASELARRQRALLVREMLQDLVSTDKLRKLVQTASLSSPPSSIPRASSAPSVAKASPSSPSLARLSVLPKSKSENAVSVGGAKRRSLGKGDMIHLISSNLHTSSRKLRQPTLDFFTSSPRTPHRAPTGLQPTSRSFVASQQPIDLLEADELQSSPLCRSPTPILATSAAVASSSPRPKFLVSRLIERECDGDSIRLHPAKVALFQRLQRLFFLSATTDQRAMTLYDMRVLRYPQYVVSSSQTSVWASRQEWIRYEWATQLEISADEALEANPHGVPSALLLELPSHSRPAFSWDTDICYQHLGCTSTCVMCLLRIAAYRLLHLVCAAHASADDEHVRDPFTTLQKTWNKALRAHALQAIESLCTSPMPLFPKIPERFPRQERTLVTSTTTNVASILSTDDDAAAATKVKIEHSASPSATSSNEGDRDAELSTRDNSFARRFQEGWVLVRTVTHLVRVVEKRKNYSASIAIYRLLLSSNYCFSRRGDWWNRLALDLVHADRKKDALLIAEAGLRDPWVRTGSRKALLSRVEALCKPPLRWIKEPKLLAAPVISFKGKLLTSETGRKSVFVGLDGLPTSVEHLALQCYASLECGDGSKWCGLHCEGGVFTTLFALLMWDVLFAPIEHVFQTKFQRAPLDMMTDSFYQSRKDLIESRLAQISAWSFQELSFAVISTWNEHYNEACIGVAWQRYSVSQLSEIAVCFGPTKLARIVQLFAQDYGAWATGLPDLCLWKLAPTNEQHKSAAELDDLAAVADMTNVLGGDAKLVEVKGPRDRLSEQQRVWIDQLLRAGIEVEVFKVLEDTSNSR